MAKAEKGGRICPMKQQIANRLGAAHVRDTVMQFVDGSMTREQAMASLGVGKTRLYELRTSFLAARAAGTADAWEPSRSGGNHMPPWPDVAQRFLKRVLSPDGDARRYSYAFAASEVGRRYGLEVDRAQVRRWALDHGIKAAVPKPRPPAHVRRWQRQSVGELWQLDATPDHFLGRDSPSLSLIDMIDDCSRMQVGCRLYRSECVNAYMDLFYRAFTRYGLPLEVYVDRASFFRGEDGNLTQLGKRLRLYGVSFVFANTPEAKGKIERVHQVWQDRLPAYAAREGVTGDTPLEDVNGHLDCLVDYPQRIRGAPRASHVGTRSVGQGGCGRTLQAAPDTAGRMVGSCLGRVVQGGGRPAREAACRRSPVPDRVRQRNARVGVPPCRRDAVSGPQQAGPVNRPSGGLHEQSEGEKKLKSIPLLLTTNFPLLKTTRHASRCHLHFGQRM